MLIPGFSMHSSGANKMKIEMDLKNCRRGVIADVNNRYGNAYTFINRFWPTPFFL